MTFNLNHEQQEKVNTCKDPAQQRAGCSSAAGGGQRAGHSEESGRGEGEGAAQARLTEPCEAEQ